MTVTRTIELADITPSELAELFCEMDGDEQAAFFAAIKPIAATWPGAGWCQQACSIASALDKDGREVIEKLAEHVLGYDQLIGASQKALNFIENTESEMGESLSCGNALRAAFAAAREDAHV